MAMTQLRDEIWATLEDLEPVDVAGYVAVEPADEDEYGAPVKLHGLFETFEAAWDWANTNAVTLDAVWVVWKP